MKTIAFFNNKGGVGKTTLVYHVAWMLAEQNHKVLAIDLDPQSNLSSMFLSDSILERLWPAEAEHKSILASIKPILDGTGDIAPSHIEKVGPGLHLVVGDLGLSQFEDKLSGYWPECLGGDPAAFRAITAFHRIIVKAAEESGSDIVLIDVGPNLGAINRAALIAADHIVVPLAPGLFSLQGLRNLGPTLKQWRSGWKQRLDQKPKTLDVPMPRGQMDPVGYIVMQYVVRRNRPVKAFQKWVDKIPPTYSEYVLDKGKKDVPSSDLHHQIGMIKNYQSLMPMAEDARKPVFLLKPADGAIGAHAQSVQKCYMEFKNLAKDILKRTASHSQ